MKQSVRIRKQRNKDLTFPEIKGNFSICIIWCYVSFEVLKKCLFLLSTRGGTVQKSIKKTSFQKNNTTEHVYGLDKKTPISGNFTMKVEGINTLANKG